MNGCAFVNQIGQPCGQPAGHKFKHGNGLITRPTDTWSLPEKVIYVVNDVPVFSDSVVKQEETPKVSMHVLEEQVDKCIESLLQTKRMLQYVRL